MTLGSEISKSTTVQQAIALLLVAVRHEAKQTGVIAVDLLAIVDDQDKLKTLIENQVQTTFDNYYDINCAAKV